MNPRKIFSNIFGWESSIAMGVFCAVCLAIVVALWLGHRRRKRNLPPSQRPKNTPLEFAYGLSVAGIAGFVIFLSFRATHQESAPVPADAVPVDVTGFQWCWQFSYPGHDVTVRGTCTNNNFPTMVVPVGQPIAIHVTSNDVIHSWWVPELRYKKDANPHHVNTFTITIDKAGRWIGRCAEFCGQRHFEMHFYLQAVSPAKYQKWLASGGDLGALQA